MYVLLYVLMCIFFMKINEFSLITQNEGKKLCLWHNVNRTHPCTMTIYTLTNKGGTCLGPSLETNLNLVLAITASPDIEINGTNIKENTSYNSNM